MNIKTRRFAVLLIFCLAATQLFSFSVSQAAHIPKIKVYSPKPLVNHDGYIVKMKKAADLKGFSKEKVIKKISAVKVSDSKALALKKEGKILDMEPNYVRRLMATPNDSYYSLQYSLPKMSAPAGWDIEKGFSNVIKVAVIDTGVDLSHPDLSSKIVQGYDFANGDSNPSDDHGHGTHVAGIIGASTNNSRGVAGVSWGAKIMPVKVLDRYGMGTDLDVANGIYYAVDNGAKVINLSLGGGWYSQTLANATTYAYNHGVLVLAAAGNDGDSSINYPAGNPYVIGVGATDSKDKRAWFSNYNSSVDICAPGVSVLSTYYYNKSHTYAYMSGTSMATPNAAGVAAVVWSKFPAWTANQIANAIIIKSNDLGTPGRDNYYGFGRVNLNAALRESSSLTYSTSKNLIGFGGKATIRGSLRPELAGQTLYMKRRRVGSTSWSSASAVTADEQGLFSLTSAPKFNTLYQFTWNGDQGIQGSSAKLRINVKSKISLNQSRTTIRQGQTVNIYGYVYPRHNNRKVKLLISKNGRRYTKYVTMYGSWTTKSKYVLRWRPSRGYYRIRASFGDTDHYRSQSRLIALSVR